jgi:hypothetical protein
VRVAPEGCSRKGPKGCVATRTRRRVHVAGVDAHGGAVARAWRSWGQGSGHGLCVREVRAHARGFWFSRAAAWPCRARSTGGPGPRHDAAARGDGGSGGISGASGSCKKKWQGGRRDRGPYGFYRGLIGGSKALAGSTGEKKGQRR